MKMNTPKLIPKALLATAALALAVAGVAPRAHADPKDCPKCQKSKRSAPNDTSSDGKRDRQDERDDERVREAIERAQARENRAQEKRLQSLNAAPGIDDSSVLKTVPSETQDVKPFELVNRTTHSAV
jgi:hypothetical protein